MKTGNILTILLLFAGTSLFSQYKYDTTKIEKIRWSPLPGTLNGDETEKISLCGTWDFYTEIPESFPEKTNGNKASIEVPGEWIMQGFEVDTNTFAGYEREFTLPAKWKARRVKLRCEAVYSDCEIFINNKKAGDHLGGFTPFEIDVTDLVKQGTNSIALKVKSESLADTLSSASQYAVHQLGGITRPIYLVALPEVNVASFHTATFFDKEYKDATLSASVKIANESDAAKDVKIVFSLYDANHKPVKLNGDKELSGQVKKGETLKTDLSFDVTEPLKWDPEHPNLYYLQCTLLVNGTKTETLVKRFGFRQIEVRGNRVYVNNKPIKLRGVCRHEADPLRGRSLTGNIWYEDVKLFKEANVNYIRTSHYPPNEKLLEACDELGMFVEEEAPFCWAYKGPVNDSNYFEAILQPTIEMIERDKSHPSILMWSLGNESHNFNELFKKSADIVIAIDSTRPRVFSFWAENADHGYLEINNDHYCGPGGPAKYAKQKRPITIDEYSHLNAYNRFELMTDPGVRDFWGEGFSMMWDKMYRTPAVLGGAIWAGIDDTFILPDGKAVGYGTWGPLDGWRRKKPEYWHVKKAYSPVKIKLIDTNEDQPVKLNVENQYFFTDLNECKIKWNNNGQEGILKVDLAPGKSKEVELPFLRSELEKLSIDIFKNSEVPVDTYVFDYTTPDISTEVASKNKFSYSDGKNSLTAESKRIKVNLKGNNLEISTPEGTEIMKGLPRLMIIPLNPEGSGTQMTKETPEFKIYSPYAHNRQIRNIVTEMTKQELNICITESYDEATGTMTLAIDADGNISISYDYILRKDVNPRQWGVAFRLPGEMQTLKWTRKGFWTVYPEDHIGRQEGEAKAFMGHPECGLAGPKTKPDWPWSEDQTRYGTNDFRSTKRNIFTGSLTNEKNTGIKVTSGGTQHLRCWFDNDTVNLLIAEYDNPGAERFFRSHARQWDKPLKTGDTISGVVKLKIEK